MELHSVHHSPSPLGSDRVRITGDVIYDDRPSRPERIWFDLPAHLQQELSVSGNPWLVCLLPLAVKLGEPLRITRPVDAGLLQQTHTLMATGQRWYPELCPVTIEADILDDTPEEKRPKTGAFFSGGVDSFYTLLESNPQLEDRQTMEIDDLITVWGFDIPLHARAAFTRMRASLEHSVKSLGVGLIDIITNLRTTRLRQCPWGPLLHGPALGAAGLILEQRFTRLLIASSHDPDNRRPYGSHPDTDPLFSTASTQVVHHGADVDRATKLERVARSDTSLKALRVCWKSYSDHNCGRCRKCFCTMLHLHLLGVLERCTTFDSKGFRIEGAARIVSRNSEVRAYLLHLRNLAQHQGRDDVVESIDSGIRRSESGSYYMTHSLEQANKFLRDGFPPSLPHYLHFAARRKISDP